jgi:hypothetical protein
LGGEVIDPVFTLRFDKSAIATLATQYPAADDARIECEVAPRVWSSGCYSKADFLIVCKWKSPRTVRHCERNDENFIESVTRTALSTTDERLRIEVLTLLGGVDWPTASVLLHFGTKDTYPILDFRALWSLGLTEPPVYDFAFWSSYTSFCRGLARESGVSMRALDRALWQFSKKKQHRRPTARSSRTSRKRAAG